MIRHAIIDTAQTPQIVVNIVKYETDISNTVPPGMPETILAVASDIAQIGWSYVEGELTNLVKPPIGTSTYSWGSTFGEVIGSY